MSQPSSPLWYSDNLAFWDERAPIHESSEFYGVDRWLAGEEHLRPFELEEMGSVDGKTLFHPQCHFGQDTLGWARHGAQVTGLDFSPNAVSQAQRLDTSAGIEARFLCGDVYEAPTLCDGQQFDIVYTGLGALPWLHDLTKWAETMAQTCAAGGHLYLAEFHPIASVFDSPTPELPLRAHNSYFDHEWHDTAEDMTGTYADRDAATSNNDTHEHVWTLGEVVTSIITAGFELQFLHEHDYTLYQWSTALERTDRGYEFPPEAARIPMMYSLRAQKR